MKIFDLDGYVQNNRVYGGLSGNKIGLTIEGKNYMVKFPGNLHEKENVNTTISYSNSPLCEYIGSHVYGILGFPVHHTELGIRRGKLVVMCEDFLSNTDKLLSFKEIKTTFEPKFMNPDGDFSDGNGTEISEVLQVIKEHHLLASSPGVEQRFWEMFVTDAFIGNGDRNNENWGLVMHADGKHEIAPVYDNGNSFNTKWDEQKMLRAMSDTQFFEDELFRRKVCCFTENEHRIHPYKFFAQKKHPECDMALTKLVPLIYERKEKIKNMIENIPEEYKGIKIASKVIKECFSQMLSKRYDLVLLPAYNDIMKNMSEEKVSSMPNRQPKKSRDYDRDR